MGFTDRDGQPTAVPDPPATGSAYERIGELQAGDYHRNAFAQGTAQEAGVLRRALDLQDGALVLDVGCGNGRHVAALRAAGLRAVGLDLSQPVLAGGAPGLVCGLAAQLPLADGAVDGVVSVCQGGFGLTPAADRAALAEWRRVLRPGGRLVLTAFSLAFAARFMGEGESLDLDRGLHHHVADVRGADGRREGIDLWTAAYTPGHLRLLLQAEGFEPLGMAGVEPGAYQLHRPPTLADPELLAWAVRMR